MSVLLHDIVAGMRHLCGILAKVRFFRDEYDAI